MRKLVAWLLVVTMIAGSMTACGSKKEETTGTAPAAAASQEIETIPTVTLDPKDTDLPDRS